MNKSILALAVAAFATAGSVNAAEIYKDDAQSIELGGRAEARMAVQDGKATDNTRVRINLKGQTQITDGLYGVGFYEGEFTTSDYNDDGSKNNDGSKLDNRYTYAGFGGEFGEVTYGKNDGALGVITDFTDIMAYHGNSAADKIGVADRTDNMLSYKGQFSDLSVKASYRFADSKEVADEFEDNGQNGYSLSAIYAIGDTGLALGGGYADQDEQNEMMFAASYTMGDLYFAGVYTDGQKAEKDADYTGYELAAAYTMGKTVFSTTYNNAELDNKDHADNVAVDATYFFNSNFRTYISYNFNLLDKDTANGITNIDAEDELALGMRYDF